MSSKRNPKAKDTWETPDDIVAKVTAFGSYVGTRGITLDPATTKKNPVGAAKIRTPDCDPDGLATDWWFVAGDNSLTFVNPPYRAEWYRKISDEAQQLRPHQHMIALLPAKPGTEYFQSLARYTSAVCFIRGRLTFQGAPEQAPFENALLYFGPRSHPFRAQFETIGWCV